VRDGGWLEEADPRVAGELQQAFDDARLRAPDEVTRRRMWGRVAEGGVRRRRRAPRGPSVCLL
jgi:hypothetical protein